MESLTRSSSARARNGAARGSVVLAVLGVLLPVVAFAAANRLSNVTLVQATAASCFSILLGGGAVLLARRGLRNVERTLGRAGGESAARVGRLLGVLALCAGLAAAIALGVYAVLKVIG